MPNLPETFRVEPSVSLSYSSPSKVSGALRIVSEEEGRRARLVMSGEIKETLAAGNTTVCTTVPTAFQPKNVIETVAGLTQEGTEGAVTTKPIQVEVTVGPSIVFHQAPELKEGTGFVINATYLIAN